EESVLGGRTVSQLGFWKQFEYRRRQQVGGRVPVDLQGLGILLGEDAKRGVLLDRLGQIDEVAIGLGDQGRVGQPGADRFGDVERGGAFGNFLAASVGKVYLDVI